MNLHFAYIYISVFHQKGQIVSVCRVIGIAPFLLLCIHSMNRGYIDITTLHASTYPQSSMQEACFSGYLLSMKPEYMENGYMDWIGSAATAILLPKKLNGWWKRIVDAYLILYFRY